MWAINKRTSTEHQNGSDSGPGKNTQGRESAQSWGMTTSTPTYGCPLKSEKINSCKIIEAIKGTDLPLAKRLDAGKS